MDIVRPPSGPLGLDRASSLPGGLAPAPSRPEGLDPARPAAYEAPKRETSYAPWKSAFPDPALHFRYLEDSEWYFAPATSHLSRWLAYELDGQFFLLARFKQKGGGETRTYAYTFGTLDEVERLDRALRTSPHPFGQVFYPRVIRAGVPYA